MSQVDSIMFWDSGFHFGLILTSPCRVINSVLATDREAGAIQWLISRTGAQSLSSPRDL